MEQKKGAIKQWIMIPINKHMDYCIGHVLQTVDCILRYFEIGSIPKSRYRDSEK